MKNIAINLNCGKSSRIIKNKNLSKLNKKSVIETTLDIFETHQQINGIVLISNKIPDIIKNKYKKLLCVTNGGESRQKSIINGIKAVLSHKDCNIIVHDACRPLLDKKVITDGLSKLPDYDIVKTVDFSDFDLIFHFDSKKYKFEHRNNFYRASSPDFFKLSLLDKLDL